MYNLVLSQYNSIKLHEKIRSTQYNLVSHIMYFFYMNQYTYLFVMAISTTVAMLLLYCIASL